MNFKKVNVMSMKSMFRRLEFSTAVVQAEQKCSNFENA